jgi:hypothetical protein
MPPTNLGLGVSPKFPENRNFSFLTRTFFSQKMKVVPNDEKIGFTILTGGRFNFAQKLCHFFFFHTIRNSPIEEGNFSTFFSLFPIQDNFELFFWTFLNFNFSTKLLGMVSRWSCPLAPWVDSTSKSLFSTFFFSYTLSFFWTFFLLYKMFFLLYKSEFFHFSASWHDFHFSSF